MSAATFPQPARALEFEVLLSSLQGPPLHRILQLVCQDAESAADACNLLRTFKLLRAGMQSSCQGLVPVKPCTNLQQARAVAAWLKQNGPVAGSLELNFATVDPINNRDAAEDCRAAVSAVAEALQTAAAATTAPSSTLELASCSLFYVHAGCAAVLQQLPISRLTQLKLSIYQPIDHDAYEDNCSYTYLHNVAAVLPELHQLRSLDLRFKSMLSSPPVVDALLQQLSGLSHLTQLALGGIEDNRELRHLPPSLKVCGPPQAVDAEQPQC